MADKMQDKKFLDTCNDFFKRGQASFEKELWNEPYYIAGRSADKLYDACIAGQLNGQWYALPLGYTKAWVGSTLLKRNGRRIYHLFVSIKFHCEDAR